MHETLIQRLNSLAMLSLAQQRDLKQVLKHEILPKDVYLLREGEVSDQIYFVLEGVIRSFKKNDDKEVTQWFSFPNHFAVPYFSFSYRQPSDISMITLSDSQLLSLSYGGLQYLLDKDSIWIDINRRLLEEYYTSLQNRVTSFQVQSAKERYESILLEHPDIAERVNLGYLASYLGISQETLSRLRAKKRRRNKV
ncbi:cAMP-binding protein [Synechococcus sp. PCC 7502]|uniref:Crp/Fnr family transcriptional regulator n=1 Tax=Synechococcus sp. PCC 7502 TaxID=1173263 RepID=UPI00029FAC93|nr:cyclic nucleotide-binding domain-containing protein [Synechococcus sp. PCC 7502]AFY73512.1 cAMP-binding protein [Synechococcus sp. PCC 7502]